MSSSWGSQYQWNVNWPVWQNYFRAALTAAVTAKSHSVSNFYIEVRKRYTDQDSWWLSFKAIWTSAISAFFQFGPANHSLFLWGSLHALNKFMTDTDTEVTWIISIVKQNHHSFAHMLFTGGRICDWQLYKTHPDRWARHNVLHSTATAWTWGRHSTGTIIGDCQGHKGT